MIRTQRRFRLCVAMTGLTVAFIWGNSLLPAEISQAFSDWVKALLMGASSGGGGEGSGLLRKIAHFAEFCALGMCLAWLFGMLNAKRRWAFLLGTGVACVDELIQCFVPHRGPALTDVGLDAAGVAAGIALLTLGYSIVKTKMKNHFGGK